MPASRPRSNASVDPEDDDEYQHQHQHQQSNEDENEHDDDGEDDSRELDPLEKKRREASSMRKLRSQLRDQYALTERGCFLQDNSYASQIPLPSVSRRTLA